MPIFMRDHAAEWNRRATKLKNEEDATLVLDEHGSALACTPSHCKFASIAIKSHPRMSHSRDALSVLGCGIVARNVARFTGERAATKNALSVLGCGSYCSKKCCTFHWRESRHKEVFRKDVATTMRVLPDSH
jgi:hypothetical protein